IFTTEPEPLAKLRPDLPDGLAAIVHRALTRDRNDRFASANDMAEALAPFSDERSAQVLARIRAGRRSQMPPRQSTVTPVAEHARATQQEATARTHASDGDQLRPAPTPASTGVGVTRESNAITTTPGRPRSPAWMVAVVTVVVAAIAGAGLLFARGGSKGGAIADTPAHAPAEPPPRATPIPPAPAAPGGPATAVVLAPEPTAAERPPAPSASARAVPRPGPAPHASATATAQTPPTPPTPGSPLPTQLGDLKLH
ncbi:MAG TPA: hypothetical protein VHV30_04900, partial [Polyangiaceae bacterium]|nr:hypothetical protein [Polyangiaceae bacterium]